MKKIFFIICLFLLIFPKAFAEEVSSSYILIESDTHQVIKAENENEPMPIASTTKIMTAILALENADTSDIFTVSEKAQNQEGSSIYLRDGEQVSVENLLYGLMLNSGNDAAVTIAEGVSGSTDAFCALMNEKAEKIGCKNTNFKNPNGLNEEGHYSTAYDMALIMSYAVKNDVLKNIMATKRRTIETKEGTTYLKNHNKLLWQYEYCDGGKTGFTKLSGRCLVTTAQKDGIRLIAVTLNNPDDWKTHKELYEYGFDAVKKTKIIEKNEILATKTINGTKVNLLAVDDAVIPLFKGKKSGVTAKIHLKSDLGDVKIGDFLGYAEIFYKDYPVAKINLKSGQRAKKTPFSFLKRIFGHKKSDELKALGAFYI